MNKHLRPILRPKVRHPEPENLPKCRRTNDPTEDLNGSKRIESKEKLKESSSSTVEEAERRLSDNLGSSHSVQNSNSVSFPDLRNRSCLKNSKAKQPGNNPNESPERSNLQFPEDSSDNLNENYSVLPPSKGSSVCNVTTTTSWAVNGPWVNITTIMQYPKSFLIDISRSVVQNDQDLHIIDSDKESATHENSDSDIPSEESDVPFTLNATQYLPDGSCLPQNPEGSKTSIPSDYVVIPRIRPETNKEIPDEKGIRGTFTVRSEVIPETQFSNFVSPDELDKPEEISQINKRDMDNINLRKGLFENIKEVSSDKAKESTEQEIIVESEKSNASTERVYGEDNVKSLVVENKAEMPTQLCPNDSSFDSHHTLLTDAREYPNLGGETHSSSSSSVVSIDNPKCQMVIHGYSGTDNINADAEIKEVEVFKDSDKTKDTNTWHGIIPLEKTKDVQTKEIKGENSSGNIKYFEIKLSSLDCVLIRIISNQDGGIAVEAVKCKTLENYSSETTENFSPDPGVPYPCYSSARIQQIKREAGESYCDDEYESFQTVENDHEDTKATENSSSALDQSDFIKSSPKKSHHKETAQKPSDELSGVGDETRNFELRTGSIQKHEERKTVGNSYEDRKQNVSFQEISIEPHKDEIMEYSSDLSAEKDNENSSKTEALQNLPDASQIEANERSFKRNILGVPQEALNDEATEVQKEVAVHQISENAIQELKQTAQDDRSSKFTKTTTEISKKQILSKNEMATNPPHTVLIHTEKESLEDVSDLSSLSKAEKDEDTMASISKDITWKEPVVQQSINSLAQESSVTVQELPKNVSTIALSPSTDTEEQKTVNEQSSQSKKLKKIVLELQMSPSKEQALRECTTAMPLTTDMETASQILEENETTVVSWKELSTRESFQNCLTPNDQREKESLEEQGESKIVKVSPVVNVDLRVSKSSSSQKGPLNTCKETDKATVSSHSAGVVQEEKASSFPKLIESENIKDIVKKQTEDEIVDNIQSPQFTNLPPVNLKEKDLLYEDTDNKSVMKVSEILSHESSLMNSRNLKLDEYATDPSVTGNMKENSVEPFKSIKNNAPAETFHTIKEKEISVQISNKSENFQVTKNPEDQSDKETESDTKEFSGGLKEYVIKEIASQKSESDTETELSEKKLEAEVFTKDSGREFLHVEEESKRSEGMKLDNTKFENTSSESKYECVQDELSHSSNGSCYKREDSFPKESNNDEREKESNNDEREKNATSEYSLINKNISSDSTVDVAEETNTEIPQENLSSAGVDENKNISPLKRISICQLENSVKDKDNFLTSSNFSNSSTKNILFSDTSSERSEIVSKNSDVSIERNEAGSACVSTDINENILESGVLSDEKMSEEADVSTEVKEAENSDTSRNGNGAVLEGADNSMHRNDRSEGDEGLTKESKTDNSDVTTYTCGIVSGGVVSPERNEMENGESEDENTTSAGKDSVSKNEKTSEKDNSIPETEISLKGAEDCVLKTDSKSEGAEDAVWEPESEGAEDTVREPESETAVKSNRQISSEKTPSSENKSSKAILCSIDLRLLRKDSVDSHEESDVDNVTACFPTKKSKKANYDQPMKDESLIEKKEMENSESEDLKNAKTASSEENKSLRETLVDESSDEVASGSIRCLSKVRTEEEQASNNKSDSSKISEEPQKAGKEGFRETQNISPRKRRSDASPTQSRVESFSDLNISKSSETVKDQKPSVARETRKKLGMHEKYDSKPHTDEVDAAPMTRRSKAKNLTLSMDAIPENQKEIAQPFADGEKSSRRSVDAVKESATHTKRPLRSTAQSIVPGTPSKDNKSGRRSSADSQKPAVVAESDPRRMRAGTPDRQRILSVPVRSSPRKNPKSGAAQPEMRTEPTSTPSKTGTAQSNRSSSENKNSKKSSSSNASSSAESSKKKKRGGKDQN